MPFVPRVRAARETQNSRDPLVTGIPASAFWKGHLAFSDKYVGRAVPEYSPKLRAGLLFEVQVPTGPLLVLPEPPVLPSPPDFSLP